MAGAVPRRREGGGPEQGPQGRAGCRSGAQGEQAGADAAADDLVHGRGLVLSKNSGHSDVVPSSYVLSLQTLFYKQPTFQAHTASIT